MLTEKELRVLLLRKQGLLQADIARKMGITQGAVSHFEANAREKIRQAQADLAILKELDIEYEKDTSSVAQRIAQLRRGAK